MDSEDKLSKDSSPYLREHAKDLVNWQPWNNATIDFARKHDKPLLICIGYASCHWCHVMDQQSLEVPEIANTMNRLFVNILIDKEERPDLDKIYQTAYQILMGTSGGWPLILFVSPHTLIPYYGGTFFPDLHEFLNGLNDVFYHDKAKIQQQEDSINLAIKIITQPRVANIAPLASELVQQAVASLQKDFDSANGGFGDDAKFPCCPTLDFLLNLPDPIHQHLALFTLEAMAKRELYDHKDGGFYRYTSDPKWQFPHKEKLLFDNAQLLDLYTQAYILTKNDFFKDVALATGNWLVDKLRDPNTGAFFCTVDSDSSKVDTKIIPSWNALTIKALAYAGKNLSYPKFIECAKGTIEHLRNHVKLKFLDDYAFLLYAILSLDDPTYSDYCQSLATEMIAKFYDTENQGFYFTSSEQQVVIFRPKIYVDDAIPSGNGLACLSLLKLANTELVKKTMTNAQTFLNDAPEVHLSMLRAYSLLHNNT